LAAAVLGGLKAVRDVVRLPPAVAMAPPAPARYWRGIVDALAAALRMPQSLIMVFRHLTRWPLRALSTMLGIALSVAVLVGTLWAFGSVEFMIDFTYHRADRQDASISFVRERPFSALADVSRLRGVLTAEPYRAVPVRIRYGHVERRISIIGKPARAELSRVLDQHSATVRLPESGIALSDMLARILKTRVGDIVELELLEGNRRKIEVPVTAVIQSFLGLTAHMDVRAVNKLMREGEMISGAHISFDSRERIALFRQLKDTPIANFIVLQRVSLQKFRQTLAENLLIQVTVLVALAAIIAFGVVYNFARISLSEQGREMASLRVLGFTRGEVSAILVSELAILTLVAQPFGWAIGYGIARTMALGFESELFRVPLIVEPNVYAMASIVVIGSALMSALFVRRRIDRLDLVEVLKTRE
jgi:putative ABC transport system permease protein